MEEDLREFMYQSWRPLIGYGAGGYALACWRLLCTCGLGFSAFADRDPRKWGRKLYGVEIVAPHELPVRFSDANIYPLVADHNLESVCSDVMALGFPKERILFGRKWLSIFHRCNHAFSINRFGDLRAFADVFTDPESGSLFRIRYRHWLLRDRPENPQMTEDASTSSRLFDDAVSLNDDLERWGEGACVGDIMFEFDNDDSYLAPRAIMALGYYRIGSEFRMFPGATKRRTRFSVRDKGVRV